MEGLSEDRTLSTAQIRKAGELLVQHHLLLHGIESSHMSADARVDLVAYSPRAKQTRTIQVKTNLRPKPAGGRGKLALDWWIPDACPAELVALVDLSEQRIWLFTHPEVLAVAQQKPAGRVHLYMHLERVETRSGHARTHINHFHDYRLAERLALIHGPF